MAKELKSKLLPRNRRNGFSLTLILSQARQLVGRLLALLRAAIARGIDCRAL